MSMEGQARYNSGTDLDRLEDREITGGNGQILSTSSARATTSPLASASLTEKNAK